MIEKFGRVVRMKNISDNYMSLIAMFDQSNQMEFFKLINYETIDRIEDALMSVNDFDTIKLTDLVKMFKEQNSLDSDDDEESKELSIYFEPDTFSWSKEDDYSVYFDEESDVSKYGCKYVVRVSGGEVLTVRIGGKELAEAFPIGRHYGFDRFLIHSYLKRLKIEKDIDFKTVDMEEIRTVYNPRDDY
jgi:hypothetical protein